MINNLLNFRKDLMTFQKVRHQLISEWLYMMRWLTNASLEMQLKLLGFFEHKVKKQVGLQGINLKLSFQAT